MYNCIDMSSNSSTELQLVKIRHGVGASLPSQIVVDGLDFALMREGRDVRVYRQLAKDGSNGMRSSPLFISIPPSEGTLEGFLPYEIWVNWGRKYCRRFDGFYTPALMKADEIEQFFDLVSRSYDAIVKTELNERVYRLLFERIDAELPRTSPARILDFGAGTGYSLKIAQRVFRQREVEVFGVDLSQGMIEVGREDGIENLWKCAYDRLPFHQGFFDGVVACYVFHYLSEPAVQLREMARVLKPGGSLALNLHKPLLGYEADYTRGIKRRQIPLQDLRFSATRLSMRGEKHSVHIVSAKRPALRQEHRPSGARLLGTTWRAAQGQDSNEALVQGKYDLNAGMQSFVDAPTNSRRSYG